MKSLLIMLCVLMSASSLASSRAVLRAHAQDCRQSEVVVDSIVRDDLIQGHVQGLPPESYHLFKMVFYVKTNRWYVHPYADMGEGYTYSLLNERGEFQVKTLRRDLPSEYLAAVLVPRSYKIRAQRRWLRPLFGIFGGVLKHSCAHTIVPGNGDFIH